MHNFFKSVKIGLKNRKNSHFGKYRHNFNTDFKIRGEGLFLVYQVEILVLFIIFNLVYSEPPSMKCGKNIKYLVPNSTTSNRSVAL